MTKDTHGRRPLVAGNWKMNGLFAAGAEVESLVNRVRASAPAADVLICPPATLIRPFAAAWGQRGVAFGGQDCHHADEGAFTGDISAAMIRDAGGDYVIVGHSERRSYYGETDQVVSHKAAAAHRAGIVSIVCVGETLAEREAGRAIDVVSQQVDFSLPTLSNAGNTVLAYEPVWAIGTGKTPSTDDIVAMHHAVRTRLTARFGAAEGNRMRILYGGSVKPANAREILALADVDGALVGGASLLARDFDAILDAYRS
ncbi:MAG: triose-phosphate isomerase [Alphaproteobacteria bacterium]|nr:triose-phosphate isomerase [Alphaproteobacteria bacterium]